MEENEKYNLNLTLQPFEGEFRRKRGAKIIYDADDKVLGAVSKKVVSDLNGEEIALFSHAEKKEDQSGKKYKSKIYTVGEEEVFRLSDGRFYSVSDGEEKLIGTCEVTERNPVRIALLAVLTVFMALLIAFIAIINLPFEGRPVINIKDNNGSWEAQGVIGVLDDKVMPGSEGEYEFVIRNPYSVELDYSFALTPRYEGNIEWSEEDYFPLTFRLRMNNALIETSEWLTVAQLEYSELSMMPNSDQSFILEWRWAFDSGNDHDDTTLGKDGGKISIVLNLTAQQGGNAI